MHHHHHQVLLTTLLLAALSSLLSASAIPPKHLPVSSFSKRDLPIQHGCRPCPGDEGYHAQQARKLVAGIDPILIAEGKASFGKDFPADYEPNLCKAHGVNCVTGKIGVHWTGQGGLTAPLGIWVRSDARVTIAWGRWQSALQWAGKGASGTVYMAHCTIIACVKGRMRLELSTGGGIKGDGTPNDKAPNGCRCFATPNDETALDADLTFSLF